MRGVDEGVRFVELDGRVMEALLAGDVGSAGVGLGAYFLTERALWLWRYRLAQMAGDPGNARWMVRYAVVAGDDVVGHAGFHGPPDEAGVVEVGYSIDPAFRRRGHAKAALRELLRRAAGEPGVRTVRATIAPDNAASLATIAGFGFVEVGEQWDEEDGLELVFEVPVADAA